MDDPWKLTTPPGSSAFEAWREPDADPPALEVLGRAEVEHNARNNRMRASSS